MKLNPRDRRALALGAAALAIVLVFYFLAVPWLADWGRARQDAPAARARLDDLEGKIIKLLAQRQQLADRYGPAAARDLDGVEKTRLAFLQAVQGALRSGGIQDLTYGMLEVGVAFFDVKKDGAYLSHGNAVDFFASHVLPIVPFLYEGRFDGADVKALSSGQSKLHAGTMREGCVVKAADEANTSRSIGRKILKAVNEDYLLRKNGTEFH